MAFWSEVIGTFGNFVQQQQAINNQPMVNEMNVVNSERSMMNSRLMELKKQQLEMNPEMNTQQNLEEIYENQRIMDANTAYSNPVLGNNYTGQALGLFGKIANIGGK